MGSQYAVCGAESLVRAYKDQDIVTSQYLVSATRYVEHSYLKFHLSHEDPKVYERVLGTLIDVDQKTMHQFITHFYKQEYLFRVRFEIVRIACLMRLMCADVFFDVVDVARSRGELRDFVWAVHCLEGGSVWQRMRFSMTSEQKDRLANLFVEACQRGNVCTHQHDEYMSVSV